jgi:hypothetical protein
LVWLNSDEAVLRLSFDSQRWAVTQGNIQSRRTRASESVSGTFLLH